MLNLRIGIALLALFHFTFAFAKTDAPSQETAAGSITEQEQSLLAAYKALAKAKDSYVPNNNVKIFGQELEAFNSTIDSMEIAMRNSVDDLLKSYDGKLAPYIIDNLFADINYIHKRYRLLYPNNY